MKLLHVRMSDFRLYGGHDLKPSLVDWCLIVVSDLTYPGSPSVSNCWCFFVFFINLFICFDFTSMMKHLLSC